MEAILVHLSKVENLEKSYRVLDVEITMFGYGISFPVSDIFLPKSETIIKNAYTIESDQKDFIIPKWIYGKILKDKINEVRQMPLCGGDKSDFKYLLKNLDKVTIAQGYGNLWGIGDTNKGFANEQ